MTHVTDKVDDVLASHMNARTRGATYTIAANDSSTYLKDSADYVCDATDDYVEIQEAIDTIGDADYHIQLLPGTYYLGSTGIELAKNMTRNRSRLVFDFRGCTVYYNGTGIAIDTKSDSTISGGGIHKSHILGGRVYGQYPTGETSATATAIRLYGVIDSNIILQAENFRAGIAMDMVGSLDPALWTERNLIDLYTFQCKYGITLNGITGETGGSTAYNIIQRLGFSQNAGVCGADARGIVRVSEVIAVGLHIQNMFAWLDTDGQIGADLSDIEDVVIDFAGGELTVDGTTLIKTNKPIVINGGHWGNYSSPSTRPFLTSTADPIFAHKTYGYKMANSGTATVLNGQTTVLVAHGLSATPTRVQLTPTNNPTNQPTLWIANQYGTTYFTITINVDPGAGGATFDWRASVGEGS